MRSRLALLGALAILLASCAKIPTPQNANNAVFMLREYDSWAWALGIALIWADVVLPVRQTAVIAALGIIYGTNTARRIINTTRTAPVGHDAGADHGRH